MKKVMYKVTFIILIAICLSLSGYVVYNHFFANETHLMTYQDKLSKLKSMNSHKAVFVGGSGTHFGISAEMFQEETGIQTVNMGLHASISLNIYLDTIEPYLNKGDYLFICPEYDYYCTPWIKTDSQNVEFSMLYGNYAYQFLTSSWDALPNTLYVGWGKWADILKQIVSLKFTGHTTESYCRFDSNEYGDFVRYKEAYTLSRSYATFTETDDSSINALYERICALKDKGINTILLYPAYADFAFRENEMVINIISERINKYGIQTLFEPNKAIVSEDDLYDTVYHINYNGKKKYTEMIIREFKSIYTFDNNYE